MPPKIRKGTGFSDKAEGCCAKCCATVCRMSGWNKLICWSGIALTLATTLLLIGGGFAVQPGVTGTSLCGPESIRIGNGSMIPTQDPTVPVLRQNVYSWYLASTGIVVIVMIVFMCLCCVSFVGLCCGLTLHVAIKCIAFLGLALFAVMMAVYIVWVGAGTYLIATYSAVALFNPVCQGLLVYVLLLYAYLVVLIGSLICVTIWSIYGRAKSVNLSRLQTMEKGGKARK